MLISTKTLLTAAQKHGYAIGAFNVYNLEGVKAVVAAAEAERSPAMLQIHPGSLRHGGLPLVALCLTAAREADVPMSVHLDHSASAADIRAAVETGLISIMADGSHLAYEENIVFTREMTALVHEYEDGLVEAELGRLSGTEDGLTVSEYEAKLTDPAQAADFVERTGIDALAVCIGNVHGRYRSEPRLDFERLAAIRQATPLPLVLHGASGLPEEMVTRSIELGVCKFNVNTEIRQAYLDALKERLNALKPPDLVELMQEAIAAMQAVIVSKLRLFGSVGKEY
jgi:tagatose 1,6-diphosphate aldolase GatY/KbaY